MASLTIRSLDETTKTRLRVRAAHRNRSMEDEARTILRLALAEDVASPGNLAEAIRQRFRTLDVSSLRLPAREARREPTQPSRRKAR